MDKIGKIFFLIIILFSCSNKHNSNLENTKIVFKYRKNVIVDFEKKELMVDYDKGLVYRDTIIMSDKEESIIINSFIKNRIGEVKGEVSYPDCYWTMPSFEDRIDVHIREKLKSTMSINIESGCPFIKPSFDSQEYRIIHFHYDVRKVLEKNTSFKRALDTLSKFRKIRTVIYI